MRKREFEKISDQVYLICDDVFPLYIINGEKNYLVDCAITARAEEYSGKIQQVLQGFTDSGTGRIDGILLTHTHYDHMGICTVVEDQYGSEIISSPVGVNLLKKQKVIDFINHLSKGFCEKLGVENNLQVKKPKCLKPVFEGDEITLDSTRKITVLETPGHTRCSLSYYIKSDKIMFPGDSFGVMEKDGSIKPLFLSSYQSYIQSLIKLQKYDIEIMCFPHNRYLKGSDKIKTFLDRAVKSAEKVKDLIVSKLNSGESYTLEGLAEEILREEFPLPTVMGPKEALMINVMAMINVIMREFSTEIHGEIVSEL